MTEPKSKEKPQIKTRAPGKAVPGFNNLRTPASLDVEEVLGFRPTVEAPVENVAPVEITPVESTPPVNLTSEPLQNVPAVDLTPAVEITPANYKKGYLKLPNEILDNVLPTMRPAEQAVYIRLYRLSHGFGETTCLISLPRLALLCHLSESQARVAVRSVIGRGYVKQLRIEQGARERGIVFEVWTPTDITGVKSAPVKTTPVETTPNKRDIKEKIKGGGYACSRCKDTGWFYPNGMDKGVAKCNHS